MDNLLTNKLDKKPILLGNEAIVRGALEGGVQFISTYPGTPSSEIGNAFFRIAKEAGVYFEFSVNEKVALEAGVGASFSGLKTLVAMKNFGLNVCLDAFIPFIYTGSKGPTVIIVADDPSCHSSAQSEENTRPLADLAHVPILEPSDPQECKDFVKLGFQMSEKFNIPIVVRITTRVAHQRMPVKLEKFKKPATIKGNFVKDVHRFVTLPPRVLEMKKELLEKIEKIREVAETSKINKIEGKANSQIGIITSGVSYLYVKEALKDLDLDLPVLKIGIFNPLCKKKMNSFIKNLKTVLIVEELEGFLEREVNVLAKEINPKLKVIGKDLLPETGELRPGMVGKAIAKIAGKKYTAEEIELDIKIPKRYPQLCPGCPYRFVFGAVKKAADPSKIVWGGDIGCYMLAGFPPNNIQDWLSCMGSSIGIAHGVKKATNQKLITFIGDSTFFHAGIPPLINTVFNRSNPLIIIMNNMTTAMTGHQPHPAAPVGQEEISIEAIVRACGVKNVKVIDPVKQDEFLETVKDFLTKDEVSVIIAKRICIIAAKKKNEQK